MRINLRLSHSFIWETVMQHSPTRAIMFHCGQTEPTHEFKRASQVLHVLLQNNNNKTK